MRELVRKFDDEQQIVYAEVYAPNLPDAHGDFMTVEGVRDMAHNFMRKANTNAVDTQHDNELNGSCIIESFVARDDDQIFLPGSWVVGVHIPDEDIWLKVKSGELNGFSMEVMCQVEEVEIELEFPPIVIGKTIADDSDHEHEFTVHFDEFNNFLGGETDVINGHSHKIKQFNNTTTDAGHRHRIFLLEGYEIVED